MNGQYCTHWWVVRATKGAPLPHSQIGKIVVILFKIQGFGKLYSEWPPSNFPHGPQLNFHCPLGLHCTYKV